jgi:hypothetical protein
VHQADSSRLPYQVQSCSNSAKAFFGRIGAIDEVKWEDNETTFEELQDRITRTIELLRTVKEESMVSAAHHSLRANTVWCAVEITADVRTSLLQEGKENEQVIMRTGMGDFKFDTAQSYWSDYCLPNVHFHLCTAYCILRHLSVPIGAFDYLGKDTFVKV